MIPAQAELGRGTHYRVGLLLHFRPVGMTCRHPLHLNIWISSGGYPPYLFWLMILFAMGCEIGWL